MFERGQPKISFGVNRNGQLLYHNPNLITSTSRFPFPCLNTPVSVGQRPHHIRHIQLLAIHTPCLMSLNADPTRPRTSLVTAHKHATKSSFPRDLGEIVPFHAYHIFGSLCRIPRSHHYLSLSIYQQNAHRHGRAFKRSTFDPPSMDPILRHHLFVTIFYSPTAHPPRSKFHFVTLQEPAILENPRWRDCVATGAPWGVPR